MPIELTYLAISSKAQFILNKTNSYKSFFFIISFLILQTNYIQLIDLIKRIIFVYIMPNKKNM